MPGLSPLLAGILGGVGGFGQSLGASLEEQRKEELRRQQLAIEQQRADQLVEMQQRQLAQNQGQFEATQAAAERDRYVQPNDIAALFQQLGLKSPVADTMGPSAARIPAAALPAILTQAAKQQEIDRDQSNQLRTAAFLKQAQGQPAQLQGQLAEGEDPEAAALIPRTPGRPPLSKWDTTAGLMALGHKDAGLKGLMDMLFPAGKFQAMSENSPGLFNTETGVVTAVDRPGGVAGPPEARPGFEIEVTTDKNGRQSYHERRITSGVDHDTLARERGYGSFAQAPTEIQAAINRQIKQDRIDVSAAQGAVALSQRPYTDQEQVALGAQNNILASTALLKQFSPEEIAAYTGLINRPIAEAKNALAGLGLADADRRFNEFKPIMGRLQGTAFGEGGKQLTGIELAVVQQYTPTGNERGGAPEVMAKVRNLEAFTKIARDTRMYLAKTGRGAVDADQVDSMIRQKMAGAGMPIPKPAPGWEDSGGAAPRSSAAPPVAGPNQLSRQDPLYSHARARGLTDQQIQSKYGITLVP